MKDHEIAQLVNQVTEAAKKFHDCQQLRQNISNILTPVLRESRHELQSQGRHPAPCARFCEANAFKVEARQLEKENKELRDRIAELEATQVQQYK